ncbi:hypothetical protein H4R18_001291 [Coemansia javaensis]|uniref:Spc7 kinetochore protein domain-containing protein n=1 Tax=Coemansia javaensis TaxID=2761396 RepID=A0A9W8HFM9_9FUNG|nr:hypothetical protein H4R18_001291 [Coemansia javaensis]
MDGSSGGDATSPKRFKANDGSRLPAGGLGEQPAEEAEQRKPRKSLGRRVSFAPTARVRVFDVPEEKQRAAQSSNTYVMPDISSQTGTVGFNLDIMPTVEDTSMASNESFDVSVRQSDMSESLQSSGGSFTADADHGRAGASVSPNPGGQEQQYANILDNEDDDDDDIDDADGDDDAVTMELTGTVDMGAINNGEESDGDGGGDGDGDGSTGPALADTAGEAQQHGAVDAANFFDILMQSSRAEDGDEQRQHTSLLDNIISEYGHGDLGPQSTAEAAADATMHTTTDGDFTRVGPMPVEEPVDEQPTAVYAAYPESADGGGSEAGEAEYSEQDEDVAHENDDAVTMELTGIVARRSSSPEADARDEVEANDQDEIEAHDQDEPTLGSGSLGVSWGQASSGTLMDVFGSLMAAAQPPVSGGPAAINELPFMPDLAAAPSPMPAAGLAAAVDASAAPTPRSTRSTRDSRPMFVLDPLPPLPGPAALPAGARASAPASRAELAKAGLVLGIFETYRRQRLVPAVSPAAAELSEFPAKFEPLFRKAELKARLEYCSALSGLFEADRSVSQAAAAEPAAFGEPAAFLEAQNAHLLARREELLARIARAKQRLEEEAPGKDTGKLHGETQELRAKVAEARRAREGLGAEIEQMGAEIQALQATSTSFDHQMSEKKSALDVLLALNGLQPADVTADSCDFIYDGFSRLHFGDTVEFTSLHPDIDWAAAIQGAIGTGDLTRRQYTIAAMKANVVLKGLLEDIRKVRQRTFVELLCTDGIQVRIQFFSKERRRRFHLQIPLATAVSYARLHTERQFDWPTEVVYGNVDEAGLKKCLRACRISPLQPMLSIYEHVDSSMAASAF